MSLQPVALAETGAEVRALAARGLAGDSAAVGELRRITSVDGRPADLARALDATGAELEGRLRVLAGTASDPRVMTNDPSRSASEILEGGRFQEPDVPRPFHGLLEWLGGLLHTLARPFAWLGSVIPGGSVVVALALGSIVTVVAIAGAAWAARRHTAISGPGRRHRASADDSPELLEEQAAAAETQGDLERALRLRFRAGLARLVRAKVVPPGEWTNRELAQVLPAGSFVPLAIDHDAIVYGGRPATPDDLERARAGWPALLRAANAR